MELHQWHELNSLLPGRAPLTRPARKKDRVPPKAQLWQYMRKVLTCTHTHLWHQRDQDKGFMVKDVPGLCSMTTFDRFSYGLWLTLLQTKNNLWLINRMWPWNQQAHFHDYATPKFLRAWHVGLTSFLSHKSYLKYQFVKGELFPVTLKNLQTHLKGWQYLRVN